jgi:TIR domain
MRRSSGYIFLSYKREDVVLAAKVRTALMHAGYVLWFDSDVQCGQRWEPEIDRKLRGASCVVVLWSQRSNASPWVRYEASHAMARDVYAPCRIELVSIDAPFNQIQATDLLDWDGGIEHPGFRALTQRIDELMPPELGPWERIASWTMLNKLAIGAVVFACASLGILVWQVSATRSQIKRLGQLADEQDESLREIARVSTAAMGAQKSAKEAADATLRQVRLSQSILADMRSSLHPITNVRVYFRAKIALTDPRLRTYQSRLEAGASSLKQRYDTDKDAFESRIRGLRWETGARGELLLIVISADHELYPKKDSERDAYQLVVESGFVAQFYKPPISFEEHPLGSLGGGTHQADTEMSFLSPKPLTDLDRSGVEIVYEFGRKDIEMRYWNILNPDWLQKRTARIESLSDLPDSQVFLTATTGLSHFHDASKNVNPELEYAILWISNYQLWFMKNTMKRHVNKNTGVPIFEYIFPRTMPIVTKDKE